VGGRDARKIIVPSLHEDLPVVALLTVEGINVWWLIAARTQ